MTPVLGGERTNITVKKKGQLYPNDDHVCPTVKTHIRIQGLLALASNEPIINELSIMYLEAQRGDTKKPGTFPEEGPVFAFTL